MSEIKLPTRSQMLDSGGRPLTQAMFLELGYSDLAIYSLKDDDFEYEGRVLPSIKKLYLAQSDPTEYTFAVTYFLNWKQWARICENKIIRKHIDEWREELEMKIRSEAVGRIIKNSNKGIVQASKWLADRGWTERGAGRPSKAEIDSEKKFQSRISDEYGADVIRLKSI